MIAVYRESASGKHTYLGVVDNEDDAEEFFADHIEEAANHDEPGGVLVTKPATKEQIRQHQKWNA